MEDDEYQRYSDDDDYYDVMYHGGHDHGHSHGGTKEEEDAKYAKAMG